MTMKEIIQLNLTQEEVLLLTSITSLGIRILRDDDNGIKSAKILVNLLNKLCPEATMSLAEKMILLCDVSKKYAKEEMIKIK